MNFLAHIYLSGNNEKVLVGNFMGDYVKGRNYIQYPEGIRKGILLHRKIDFYTDNHPVTKQSRLHLADKYSKYSGIVVDIFYDYLLTLSWANYCNIPLPEFVNRAFHLLRNNYDIFPQGIKNFFPNFIRNNWLIAYSTIEGMETVLQRMSSRTSLPEYTEFAIQSLRERENEYLEEFNQFFPDIRNYILQEFGIVTGSLDDTDDA
ncbi:MAG: ACP phosphodiesterase [Bacteroidales bacterium]|nr:ACP phosphodiesterase [Bacteroidales bacterium]MCF8389380.1 ACP phosphodiesterase [Bacteroidales bacterium]